MALTNAFVPIYTPILQLKQGELDALATLNPMQRVHLAPLFVFQDDWKTSQVTNIIHAWGRHNPLYADIHHVSALEVAELALLLSNAGLRPVPAVRPDSSLAHFDSAIALKSHVGGTVCLRIPPSIAYARDSIVKIRQSLEYLESSATEVELLIDFGHITDHAQYLPSSIQTLESLGAENWRSIIIAGSTFPSDLNSEWHEPVIDDITRIHIPRTEFQAFESLIKGGFGSKIHFADYTVTHAIPSPKTGKGYRPTANLRYSRPDEVLVLRGKYDNGNEDMVRICNALVKTEDFMGETFSHGDKEIYRCAKRGDGHGASPQWRAWDINHHIKLTLKQLSSLTELG